MAFVVVVIVVIAVVVVVVVVVAAAGAISVLRVNFNKTPQFVDSLAVQMSKTVAL